MSRSIGLTPSSDIQTIHMDIHYTLSDIIDMVIMMMRMMCQRYADCSDCPDIAEDAFCSGAAGDAGPCFGYMWGDVGWVLMKSSSHVIM